MRASTMKLCLDMNPSTRKEVGDLRKEFKWCQNDICFTSGETQSLNKAFTSATRLENAVKSTIIDIESLCP